MVKFLIVGDLHGNKPKIYYDGFDAIIAPGDFCSDAPRKYMFQSLREHLKNPETAREWYEIVGRRKAREMVKKSLADGREILEFLNSFDVPVYIVPGNWDWTHTRGKESDWNFLNRNYYKDLTEGLSNIVDVYHKIVSISDYAVVGHGITSGPEFPQHKDSLEKLKKDPKSFRKAKKEYERLYDKVSALFKKAKKPVIFMSHNVPYNTPIDKITNRESPRYGMHYGSLIAREMIERYQPLVCIGGHMHEHFRKCRIGKTTAINAGFGSYVNVWMELDGNRIKKLEFYKGR